MQRDGGVRGDAAVVRERIAVETGSVGGLAADEVEGRSLGLVDGAGAAVTSEGTEPDAYDHAPAREGLQLSE